MYLPLTYSTLLLVAALSLLLGAVLGAAMSDALKHTVIPMSAPWYHIRVAWRYLFPLPRDMRPRLVGHNLRVSDTLYGYVDVPLEDIKGISVSYSVDGHLIPPEYIHVPAPEPS